MQNYRKSSHWAWVMLSFVLMLAGCGDRGGKTGSDALHTRIGENCGDVVVLAERTAKNGIEIRMHEGRDAEDAVCSRLGERAISLGVDEASKIAIVKGCFWADKKIADFKSARTYALMEALSDYVRTAADLRGRKDGFVKNEVGDIQIQDYVKFGDVIFKALNSVRQTTRESSKTLSVTEYFISEYELCCQGSLMASVKLISSFGEDDNDASTIVCKVPCGNILRKLNENGMKISLLMEAIATEGGMRKNDRDAIEDCVTQGNVRLSEEKMVDSGVEGYSYCAVYEISLDSKLEFAERK